VLVNLYLNLTAIYSLKHVTTNFPAAPPSPVIFSAYFLP
jgi:hypothetical protein